MDYGILHFGTPENDFSTTFRRKNKAKLGTLAFHVVGSNGEIEHRTYVTSPEPEYMRQPAFITKAKGKPKGTYQQQRPRITSRPNHPLISTSQGTATFNWTFMLWPGTTWNDRIVEVVFGTWRPSGTLSPKLMVITKEGGVLIRPHFENKVSCEFNTSRLQVAFMLNNLSVQDEKQYGVQIEFGLAYNPLTDAVSLRLQDPPKIINPSKRNINIKTGADLNLTCAAKGHPSPQITWTRLGRQMKNQTVVLRQLTKEDSGLYLCTARNAAGKDTMEVNVIVEDEESMQTVEPSTTNSEHTTDNEWMTLLFIILAAFVFLMASLLITYFVCKRLRNTSIRYNPQVDTGTPNSQSI